MSQGALFTRVLLPRLRKMRNVPSVPRFSHNPNEPTVVMELLLDRAGR